MLYISSGKMLKIGLTPVGATACKVDKMTGSPGMSLGEYKSMFHKEVQFNQVQKTKLK